MAGLKSITAEKLSRLTQAVIVGVSHFDEPGLNPLPQCLPEAAKLAKVLSSPNACKVPEGNIRLLPEEGRERVARRDVLDAISTAAAKLEPEGLLLLFFASHGWENDDGFVIATTESRESEAETGIRAIDIAACLSESEAGGLLLITDCCGGAGIAESSDGLVHSDLGAFGFRVVISSASRGEIAWDFEDGGSPFARALLSALEGQMSGIGSRGEVFLSALFDHVQNEVFNYFHEVRPGLGQTPRLNASVARDPLLFANADATLRSIEFARSRLSREAAQRMVRRTAIYTVAIVIVVAVAVYTFVDQHRFLATDEEGRIGLYYGHPLAEFLTGRRQLWQTAMTGQHLDPKASLARNGVAAFHKSAKASAVLEASLSTAGSVRLALVNGEVTKNFELPAAPMDRPDIEIAVAERTRDSRRLLDLTGHTDENTALGAVASLARIDPSTFLRARHNRSGGRFQLLDRAPSRVFYAEAAPFTCDAAFNDLLGKELGYGVAPVRVARLHLLGLCPISLERSIRMAMPGLFAALAKSNVDLSSLTAAVNKFGEGWVLFFLGGLSDVPCIASQTVPSALPDDFQRTDDLKRANRAIDWMVHAVRSCNAELTVDFDMNPKAAVFSVKHGRISRHIALSYDATSILNAIRLTRALPSGLALRDLSARLAALDALNDASTSNALALVLYNLELLAKHPGARELAEKIELDRVLSEARLSFLWRAAPARAFAATVASLTTPTIAERHLGVAASHASITVGTQILEHDSLVHSDPATRVQALVLFGSAKEAVTALTGPLRELREVAWHWVCARADLSDVLHRVKAVSEVLPHGLGEREYQLSLERASVERMAGLPVNTDNGHWLWQHLPRDGGCRVLALRSRIKNGDVVSYWEDPGIR